jgi:hypothetical protein
VFYSLIAAEHAPSTTRENEILALEPAALKGAVHA